MVEAEVLRFPSLRGSPNVACRFYEMVVLNVCRLFFLMSLVKFKKRAMSHGTTFVSPCRMLLCPMSHVKFQKCPCCPVGFRSQGPLISPRLPRAQDRTMHH